MKPNGFSLLELSIVLVIIGLIAGGIVAGSSMIRAAEIRATITQQEQFRTAIYTFRDKYLGLPGDLKNAYAFWNNDARCAADQVVTAADDTGCNGDGDGQIEFAIGEQFTSWMHLSLAGLISGDYNGSFASTGDYKSGENVPESKVGSFWLLYYNAPLNVAYTSGSGWDKNKNGFLIAPALNSTELYGMDTKIDDGKPGLGKMTSQIFCNIADNTVTDTAEYDFTDDRTCNAIIAF